MKRPYYFIVLAVLALSISFFASANDSLSLDNGLDSNKKNSMTWPALPGESVSEIARLFYPNNKAMQKAFVAKTLQLSAESVPNLKASQRFESPTLLVVPTIKSLSKKSSGTGKKASNKALKMSYGLKQMAEGIPAKLRQEYNDLVDRNVFLKEQLAKLNKKIVFLESKLESLKLMLDKNLSLPSDANPFATAPSSADISSAPANETAINVPIPASQTDNVKVQDSSDVNKAEPHKKVFKNLDQPELATPSPDESSFFDGIDSNLVKVVLAALALLLLGAFGLKKYRERMFAQLSFAATTMQKTVTNFGAYLEKPKQGKTDPGPETIQQQQAAREVESRLSATLEEAKLLMSVNRSTDAIAHLKMTIESQPKATINHWLYLLEVFRRLNLKEEFEQYAEKLHETFNVMTPVWYEKELTSELVVPQSLQQFPHIIEQLCGVWPGELASVYLRGLITDNRGGERIGFGKAVVSEILFLIELLDTRKDILD